MSKVLNDKAALIDWEEFRKEVQNATTIDRFETPEQKRARIANLEKDGNHEAWFKYYFPNYYSSEPAEFHIEASNRVMENPEWYEMRGWSRELAKSTRSMMEDLYLFLRKKKKFKLLCSSSWDNACRLFEPYRINLESNKRIINDYGKQKRLGSWEAGEIITRSGFALRAVGKGQPPRGARFENIRPDIIEFDDLDTDEDCLNEDTVDKTWEWVTGAVIPTRSISVPTLIRWNGNLIAEDCCVVRAMEFADHVDVINIRDENGKSTWPSKNTEEFIDRVLSKLPESAQQKEYFNNPHTKGKSFRVMTWGKVPPINTFKYLVAYSDPSTSNKDLANLKSKKGTSCKAVVLLGKQGLKYYVIKAFVQQMSNPDFVGCMYFMPKLVNGKTVLYNYIENNSLQAPFYEQVILPLIFQHSRKIGVTLSITPDTRDKPDKYLRIDAISAINNLGLLILNEEEKNDPHMKRLEFQFKSVGPRSKTMDGPDAVEGGIFIIDQKEMVQAAGSVQVYKRKANNKRY